MLISHNKNGAGGGKSAEEYLLATHDSNNIERAGVEVLRGNPASTTRVIDSITNKWKYSSAVIAWAPEDNPTDEQIESAVDDYYALAFAGIEENRYSSYAVLHREQGGGVHVHIISARIDLQTGKAYNPCPPNAEYLFNDIARHYNYKNGWARPDDPARSKALVKPKHEQLKDAQAVKESGFFKPNDRDDFKKFIEDQATLGLVTSQEDVVQALSDWGEITRVGRNYISIKVEGQPKAIRLKGGYFSEKFSGEISEEATGRFSASSRIDEKKSQRSFNKFISSCAKKAKYNLGRYGESDRESTGRNQANRTAAEEYKSQESKVESREYRNILASEKAPFDDSYISDFDFNTSGPSEHGSSKIHSVGDDSRTPKIQISKSPGTKSRGHDSSGQYGGKSNLAQGKAGSVAVRKGFLGDRNTGGRLNDGVLGKHKKQGDKPFKDRRHLLSELPRIALVHGEIDKQRLTTKPLLSQLERDRGSKNIRLLTVSTPRGGVNDGARNEVTTTLERANRACGELVKRCEEIKQSSGNFGNSITSFFKTTRRKLMNNKDELQRFKVEINISEYLASKGFELDKSKSCMSYAVMRKDNLKYVVTRAQDGHYVYTDAHNPQNAGSIIDACQSLTGKNLGQTRKELRPWIGAFPPKVETIKYQAKVEKTEADFPKIIASWEQAKPVFDYSYFQERKIDIETVNLYRDNIKQTENGTLLFRHFTPKSSSVSGFEYKSKDYAGFSKGGQKGLCVFRNCDAAGLRQIKVCETALDALSKAQLEGLPKDVAYVSLAGNPSIEQIEQLKTVVDHYGLDLVTAVDNDKGGDLIAKQINAHQGECKRELPMSKDWNMDLMLEREQEEQELDVQDRDLGLSM